MFCHYWRDSVVALFMLTQHAADFARCGVQIKIPQDLRHSSHSRLYVYLDLEEGEAAAVTGSCTVHYVWHTERARLTKSDRGRHGTGYNTGPRGRRTDCCTVSFWGCRCPTPDSSHDWLMWGDCRLGSGTACWMRTATGWMQSADCWQTLTCCCCCCCDRISVLTLQAWLSIHWIRNIRKFQCFIW